MNLDEDSTSDNVEDRRAEGPDTGLGTEARKFGAEAITAAGNVAGYVRKLGTDRRQNEADTQKEASDATEAFGKGYADGGPVTSDDDADDQGGEGDEDSDDALAPTDDEQGIPTTADDPSQQENASVLSQQQDDGQQQGGPADQQQGPVPGAAQSPGQAPTELMALIRAVNQYGLKKAGMGGGQQPQAQSFANGGLVRGYEDGGAIPTSDDDQEAAPQAPEYSQASEGVTEEGARRRKEGRYEFRDTRLGRALGMKDEGAGDLGADAGRDDIAGAARQIQQEESPANQAASTREVALNKSGLGGAFGAAQQARIDASRPGANENTAGGGNDHSTDGTFQEPPKQFSQPNTDTPSGLGKLPGMIAEPFKRAAAGYQQGYQKLIAHLKGDDAIDANTNAAINYAVNPDGSLPPVVAKMRAVQYAYQKGLQEDGDPRTAMNLALGVLQHQRKEYDMWRTAAAVKLSQNDMGSAVDAANKAFRAPFGDNVNFAQSGGGRITATVTGSKGEVQGSFPMLPAQFEQLMKSHGKFDTLVQQGLFDTLAALAPSEQQYEPMSFPRTGGAAPAPKPAARPQAAPQAQAAQPAQPKRSAFEQAPEGVDQKVWDQSRRIFPMVSQNSQRELWVAQQMEKQGAQSSKESIARMAAEERSKRNAETQTHIDARQEKSLADRDQRQDKAIANRRELFDKGWEQRTLAAAVKQAGANRNDPANPRKTALVKSLLAEHSGDPEGFRKALKDAGIDYDRDILGNGPPQTAPQVSGGAPNAKPVGAPAAGNAAPEAAGQAPTKAGGKPAPPKVGETRGGFRFLGGNPADKAAWERVGG
jgi:hypothetical protein